MSGPIQSVLDCQLGKLGKMGGFSYPALDDFGAGNMIRAALQAFLENLQGIIGFIKQYIDPKKITGLVNDIKNLPETLIKNFVDKFFSKLKIPNLQDLMSQTIEAIRSRLPAGFEIPTLPLINLPLIFVDIIKGMLTGHDPIAALMDAVKPIISALTAASEKVREAVAWVADWITYFAKMILMFLSFPLFVLKLAMEFITNSVKDLLNGFGGLISYVKNKLTTLVMDLLKALGLDIQIPGVPIQPFVAMIQCFLIETLSIITGFPGNIPGLIDEVA